MNSGIYLGFSKKETYKLLKANLLACLEVIDEGANIEEQLYQLCSPGGVGIEILYSLSTASIKRGVMDAFIAGCNKDHYLMKGENE